MLKEHIENNDVIRLISHNDADGISAAAVIANALKEEGAQFHTTIVPRLKDDVVNQLRHEQYNLFIFSDMGSAYIRELNSFKSDVIVADHHQVSDVEADSNLVHVNPHLFEIDGSKVEGGPIYVLKGEQLELFKKDMQEITKYINIARIEYKNLVLPDTYEIKEILSEAESKSFDIKEENIEEENTFEVKRRFFSIVIEKICKLFNINLGINKEQKKLPVYNKKC